MDKETQYVNKYYVAGNKDEVVLKLTQLQPTFDENANITGTTEKEISNVVMPASCAKALIQSLAICLNNAGEQNNG